MFLLLARPLLLLRSRCERAAATAVEALFLLVVASFGVSIPV